VQYIVRLDQQRLGQTAAVAEEAVRSGGYASLALGVADRTQLLWRHVVPGGDGTRWDSIFKIASISKPVTITALMQFVERGQLVLRDHVAEYIPEWGQNGKEQVTIWHLATHTSGLDELDGEGFEALSRQRAPLSAYLDRAYRAGLRFAPGEQWSYAQLPYSVLGELMARLSGKPYPVYMHEHLFAPLGMQDTAFTPVDPARLVPQFGERRPAEERAYHDSLAFPAFGLYSTVSDLLVLGQALLNNGKRGDVRVLSESAVTTMARVHTGGIMAIEDGKPSPTFQGLGWGMRSPFGNVLGSERGYGHAGAGGSWMWIDPDWDLVFVLLSNSASPKPNIATKLLNTVYGVLERS